MRWGWDGGESAKMVVLDKRRENEIEYGFGSRRRHGNGEFRA